MSKTRLALLWLVAGTFSLASVRAADLEQVLSDLSGGDAARRTAAIQKAERLGARGVDALCKMMTDKDPATRASARKALFRLAMYACRPGAEQERAALVEALSAHLAADKPEDVRLYAADLLGLVGSDKAVEALAALLREPQMRERARVAIERIPGKAATEALTAAIAKSDGDFRAALISSLGARRDLSATETILRYAEDANPAVRNAAIAALGRIGSPRAEKALRKAIDHESTRTRAVALDAYLRLAATFESSRSVLAREMYDRILDRARQEQYRCAALLGLGRVGSTDSVSRLAEALESPHARIRSVAMESLRSLEGPGVAKAIASRLADASKEATILLLECLAGKRDSRVMADILPYARDDDIDVRFAAYEALGKIGDVGAAGVLLDVAKNARDREEKVRALRATLNIAQSAAARGETDHARRLFAQSLRLAPLNEIRRVALNGLAATASADLEPLVEPLIGDPDLGEAALVAYAAVARAIEKAGKPDRAREMYRRILDLRPPLPLLAEIVGRLNKMGVPVNMAQYSGFVTHWWIIGPFPSPNQSLWDASLFPEKEIALDREYEYEGRKLRWRKVEGGGENAIVDLMSRFQPNQDVVAYAYAEIVAPKDENVRFKFGSDDGIIAWINGKRIHVNKVDRGLEVDQDVVDGQLVAGKNTILLKIMQNKGGWCFCMRITDRNDRPLRIRQE